MDICKGILSRNVVPSISAHDYIYQPQSTAFIVTRLKEDSHLMGSCYGSAFSEVIYRYMWIGHIMKMKSFFKSIISGSGDRPTRFHDERGNLVTPGGYIYALNSLFTTFLRVIFGYRPPIPWLSFRARRYIAGLLCSDCTVLEFGSGMSTAWFASRCRVLYSFEHDPKWYGFVKARLSKKKITNVFYSLRNAENYADLSEFPDGSFDFVLIDGIRRTECVRNVISKVKPDGWIYLDNTDVSQKTRPGNDFQEGEKLLLSFIPFGKGFVKYFTDFVPSNFIAKQGVLVNLGQ